MHDQGMIRLQCKHNASTNDIFWRFKEFDVGQYHWISGYTKIRVMRFTSNTWIGIKHQMKEEVCS